MCIICYICIASNLKHKHSKNDMPTGLKTTKNNSSVKHSGCSHLIKTNCIFLLFYIHPNGQRISINTFEKCGAEDAVHIVE